MTPGNSLLAELRRYYEERQSGALTLSHGSERVEIVYREGLIEAASSNTSSFRLGSFLVKEASLDAHLLASIEAEGRRRKIKFGEAALRKKFIDPALLGNAVRRQVMELIAHVCTNGFLVSSFANGLRSYQVPAHVSFPHILLELSRSNPALIELPPGVRLRLSSNVDLSGLPWFPLELCVLAELRYPSTIPDLLSATGLEEATLQRILGVFHRLSLVQTVAEEEIGENPSLEDGALMKKAGFPFEQLIPSVTNAVVNEKLEVARNISSFTSEQFRSLKVRITEATAVSSLKVITVSSPDMQDGKSLISANLAFSFAMDPGRRVIIVDCDLRRPSLDKFLGVSSEPGLLKYLESGRIGPYCFTRRVGNLFFMTSGGVATNPIEVLSMRKMRELIDTLKADFDTVILDAPPFSPIADARIVTGLSDGLIMVVRRGKTAFGSADRSFKAIDRSKLLGVVFNDVKPMLFHTHHSYGYYRYGNHRHLPSSKKPVSSRNYLEP